MDKTISIIVPVYNAANYIATCCQSIIDQGVENSEVIFIDDCSTDDSYAKILENRFSLENAGYEVIIIRQQRNQGVASARNKGLDIAKGQYIYFHDADDTLEKGALKIMLDEAQKRNADIVGCEWRLKFAGNSRHMRQPAVQTGGDIIENFSAGIMRWNLWLFLVRKTLYDKKGVRFLPEMNIGEDLMIMLKVASNAQRAYIIHQPFYNYNQTNSLSISKRNTPSEMQQVETNIKEAANYLLRNFPDQSYEGVINSLKLNIKQYLLVSPHTQDYLTWQKWMTEANDYVNKDKRLPLRTRLLQIMAKKNQFWYLKLYYYLVIKFVYGLIYH